MPYKKIKALINQTYESLLMYKEDPKIMFILVDRGDLEGLKSCLIKMDINALGSDDNNLLIHAIKTRENFNPNIIHYLIAQHINVEHTNRQSTTALLECIYQLKDYPIDKEFFIEITKTLIQKSSEKHLKNHLSLFGNTATTACVKEQPWMLPFLFEKGITFDDINFNYSNLKGMENDIQKMYDEYKIKDEQKHLEKVLTHVKDTHKSHKI